MRSTRIFRSVAVATLVATVHSQSSPSDEPVAEASDIEAVVPSQILDPAYATSIAAAADSFIASVTAAPQYSSVVSVLATAIPITAQIAIEQDPNDFLIDIARGSPPPAWATALPPSVGEYLASIAEDAARIITSDFGPLYTSVSSQVAALETGATISGGFALPTGGYGGSNFTGPRPTASVGAPSPGSEPFIGAAPRNVGSFAVAVVAASMGLGAFLLF